MHVIEEEAEGKREEEEEVIGEEGEEEINEGGDWGWLKIWGSDFGQEEEEDGGKGRQRKEKEGGKRLVEVEFVFVVQKSGNKRWTGWLLLVLLLLFLFIHHHKQIRYIN